jgi:hypothetical protein
VRVWGVFERVPRFLSDIYQKFPYLNAKVPFVLASAINGLSKLAKVTRICGFSDINFFI